MKRKAHIFLKITLALLALMFIPPALSSGADAQGCKIIDITVDKGGRIEVTGDSELDYRFFQLSEPARLVFDFKNALMAYNSGKMVEMTIDSEYIKKIRVSQFSLKPDIVRLVIEPKSPDPARISRFEKGTKLAVFFGDVIEKVTEDPTQVKDETPDQTPLHITPPVQPPFRISNTTNGLAVDITGVQRSKIRIKEKIHPDRLIIDTDEIFGDKGLQSLGQIKMESGPVSNYESFSAGDDFRLVLYLNGDIDYNRESSQDGVRVLITSQPDKMMKVLASEDGSEVDGFVFETPETAEATPPEQVVVDEPVKTVVDEIEVDTLTSGDGILMPMLTPEITAPQSMEAGGDEYKVSVGDMIVVNTNGLKRVSVGNPTIISVNVISQEEILVTALAAGRSAIMTWEAGGANQVKWINVADNVEIPESQLTKMIGNPDITAKIVGDHVVLEGYVDTDLEKARAAALATSFGTTVVDLVEVLKPKQVMVKVRMVEIDKKALEDNFNQISAGARSQTGDFTFSIVSALLDPELPGGGLVDTSVKPGIINRDPGDIRYDPIDLALDYLETNRQANILSEPNVLALHGVEAKFRVGGEVPFQYQNERGVLVVDFKEFGIQLDMTPLVNSKDGIRLKLHPVVRTVDLSLSISGIPGFRTREVNTEVQLKSGETMVIGGLIQNEITKTVAKIPLLGDIPILGQLFKSKKFQEDTTELLVFITPIILSDDEDLQTFVADDPLTVEEREALFEQK